MPNALPTPRLLLITDRGGSVLPLTDTVRAAVAGGCRWIMVREKDLDRAALIALAGEIVDIAAPAGAVVLINRDVEAAASAGAGGVHVQSGVAAATARDILGADALIGVSAHDLSEARLAAECGADYVTISPVFATGSKPGYGPLMGLHGLRGVCEEIPVPVIALAGVTARNARACIAAGAAGVAAMGGVMRADDPEAVVRDMIRAVS